MRALEGVLSPDSWVFVGGADGRSAVRFVRNRTRTWIRTDRPSGGRRRMYGMPWLVGVHRRIRPAVRVPTIYCPNITTIPDGTYESQERVKHTKSCPKISDSFFHKTGNAVYSNPRTCRSQFQAAASVSSSERSAFHPKTVLARVGSAQIATMSPARRGAIL